MSKIYNYINPFLSKCGDLAGTLAQAVLPARCPVSGAIVDQPGLIHPTIWQQIDFIDRPFCARCGIRFEIPVDHDETCPACLTTPPRFDGARAAVAYDDTSREMILAFKHGDQTHLTTSLTPWVARAATDFHDTTDIIIPVPLHRWRLLARRYNQAGLLARSLAKLWDKPFAPDILQRVKSSPSQGHKTRAERLKNVAGVFRVAPATKENLKGQNVLLVDDVYTTGATVNACARVLKRAGAASVNVVTIARVMRPITID